MAAAFAVWKIERICIQDSRYEGDDVTCILYMERHCISSEQPVKGLIVCYALCMNLLMNVNLNSVTRMDNCTL